jgi:outer membrane protein insertion porin family
MQFFKGLALSALIAGAIPGAVAAQDAAPPQQAPPAAATLLPAPAQPASPGVRVVTPCGNVLEPAAIPPDGSGPVAMVAEACFSKQGGSPTVDTDTYRYYMQFINLVSDPGNGLWQPYTEASVQTLRSDFDRLWETGFLEDLQIEVTDFEFPNGVIGKMVTYHMEERPRVRIITYEGTDQLDRTRIEEQLQEQGISIPIDSLLDERKIRQVETIVRQMMTEKGFSPDVRHTITPTATGLKSVNVTFHINEGPRIKIREVDFIGNAAFSDGTLQRQLADNKPVGLLSFITGTGTYNAAMFEDDAEKITAYYMDRGYPGVRVGQPQLTVVEDSTDGKTRWVDLEIPITEGSRYVFGDLDFSGNTFVRTDFLRTLYDLEAGETYSRKKLIEGNRRAQELYGELGYMEFVPFPDLRMSDLTQSQEERLASLVPEALTIPAAGDATPAPTEPPNVDVTIQITEGEQFFVNRIVFTGNTTTRDNVIRRELGRLVEGAPFDSTALETSIRRLNQLGYFLPLEGNERDMKVDKTPDKPNMVDVTFNLEEQNRNQLTFGAGISQYEGFFGQLAFQTSNFLGRGESLTVSMQGGDRAQNYQLGFTEPFLFDRNITGGFDLHKRSLQYLGYYTQKSTGGNLVFGLPVSTYTRMFLNYAYEEVSITDLNEALLDTSCLVSAQGCSTISSLGDLSQLTPTQIEVLKGNPFFFDSLLIGQGGKRTISKFVPTLLHNTVDHPIFPTRGTKYTAAVDLAVLGGNTQFYKPQLEGIWFLPHTSRTSLGLRAQFEYIAPLNDTEHLPVFERLFLGGEYSVRGYDIRSIGPTVEGSRVVLGGNKSLLVNAEYQISIAQPVRLVLFYDAGQVRDFGESFAWQEDLTEFVFPDPPLLLGPFGSLVQDPDAPGPTTEVVGRASAFKTSTGVELRFFMPVLNVPFRLIYAWNPQRGGVLDNDLLPAKRSTFKFSVGTTF